MGKQETNDLIYEVHYGPKISPTVIIHIINTDEEERFQSLDCKTLNKTVIREQIIRDEWRGLIRHYSAVTESKKHK